MGGDLAGVSARLGHLKELGVSAIWLTPIFEATSNHRYDTADYRRVDPRLGDKAALERLVVYWQVPAETPSGGFA
jgi:glycosidase